MGRLRVEDGGQDQGRTMGVITDGREKLVRLGPEAGIRGSMAGEAAAEENGLWPTPPLEQGRKERDTANAYPQPLTSARLQPEGPGATNEEAQQQLQREPGRRKLCLTWKGQGAASESPHMANVPKSRWGVTDQRVTPSREVHRPLRPAGMPGREIQLLPNAGPHARCTVRPNNTRLSLEQRKAYRWAPTLGATTVTGEEGSKTLQDPTLPTVGNVRVLSRRRLSPWVAVCGTQPPFAQPEEPGG